jgi:adenylate cyclase
VVPTPALAVKAAALARMTGTLMETYLGRDVGRRVLSDLRGFTRITDSAPSSS